MADVPKTTAKLRLEVEQSEGGWWYVTSPDIKGLLTAQPTMERALAAVPSALADLAKASGT